MYGRLKPEKVPLYCKEFLGTIPKGHFSIEECGVVGVVDQGSTIKSWRDLPLVVFPPQSAVVVELQL